MISTPLAELIVGVESARRGAIEPPDDQHITLQADRPGRMRPAAAPLNPG
jgi:hypothetical protein